MTSYADNMYLKGFSIFTTLSIDRLNHTGLALTGVILE